MYCASPHYLVNPQIQALLQIDIPNNSRSVTSPQPPAKIDTTLINPTSTENTGVVLKQFYTPLVLLASLMVGITFIPLLLLEEKEVKTLRMLLDTTASFKDILLGKLLVVLAFQLAITSIVLAIIGGFTGTVPLIVLTFSQAPASVCQRACPSARCSIQSRLQGWY